jgi:hypothetical protein
MEEFQIVSNTYRKHNATSTLLQISTIFNGYGPIGAHFGNYDKQDVINMPSP